MKKLSIVVPCYNEESNIAPFYEAVKSHVDGLPLRYELVFVDDGSSDNTLAALRQLSDKVAEVRYLSFSRNFGKESAMLAGLQYAEGDAVLIMDGDLQHPPRLIPDMWQHFEEGYDQVIARRNRNGEQVRRKWLTKLYYRLMNNFVDVPLVDGAGDFRLLSRRAVDSLLQMTEYNRFSKGLFSWIGFKEKMIEYDNEMRNEGTSKWSFNSLLNYGIDGVISFNNRPLRLAIYAGIFITVSGFLYIIFNLFNALIHGVETPGYFTTISAVVLLGGIQLLTLGIIGEYIGRIYYETKKRPHYLVQEKDRE
ncbi:glycosyltransferase family 2 protein [Sporosarcina sp. FSL K6-1522]|uniref:glycosyltransferase family 2 protein n=1 Tax=Sporosarcina sp. FSL K6-1522 TaxID=2921554 RepID=UPI00315AA176